MRGVGVTHRVTDEWIQLFFDKAAGNDKTWKAEVCVWVCVCVCACVRACLRVYARIIV